MKKYFILLKAAIVMFAAFTLYSCEKETETISQSVIEQSTDSILTINGKRMEWKLNLKNGNKLSKGFHMNTSDLGLEFGTAYYTQDPSKRYTTMKVRRRNSERYFYIMIENLDIELDTACWAYKNDESYVSKYGRMYTWNSGHALAKKINMKLPVYDTDGNVIAKSVGTPGRLLNTEDVLDIIEAETIGNLPTCGYHAESDYEKWGSFYFDTFVFGVEDADGDLSKGHSVLSGNRLGGGGYTGLNKAGYYWMDDGVDFIKKAHYEFRFAKETHTETDVLNYSAFINSLAANSFGHTIRCVFEPRYVNKKKN